MLWMQDLSCSRFRRLVLNDCVEGWLSRSRMFFVNIWLWWSKVCFFAVSRLLFQRNGQTSFIWIAAPHTRSHKLPASNNGSLLFTFTLSHTIIPWRHALNSRDCRRSRPYFTDFKFDCTSTSDNRILFITDQWGHKYIWFASMFSCRIG